MELARALGVQVSDVRAWEAGRRRPPRGVSLLLSALHAPSPAVAIRNQEPLSRISCAVADDSAAPDVAEVVTADRRSGVLTDPAVHAEAALGLCSPRAVSVESLCEPCAHAIAEADVLTVGREGEPPRPRRGDNCSETPTTADFGVWTWDVGAGRLICSPACCRLYGLSAGLRALSVGDVIALAHPEDRARMRQALECSITSGRLDIEFRLEPAGGPVRWLAAKGEAISWLAGAPMQIIGISYEIMGKTFNNDLATTERSTLDARFVENMPALAWIKDRNLRLVYYNKTFSDFFDISKSEWLGKTDFEIWPDSVARMFRRSDQQALSAAGPIETIEEFTTLSGDRCVGAVFKFSIDDGTGQHLVGGIGVDITRRVQAEEAHRESEVRFRTLTEAMPQLVWTTRPDGACDYVSRQWIDYTGKRPPAVLDWGWLDVIHPEDRPSLLETWERAVQGLRLFDHDVRLRGNDGVYRWFKQRAMPLIRGNGEHVGWIGTSTEINQLIEAREALRVSEARYRVIGESIPYGVWVCDADGGVEYLSPSYLTLIGMTMDQARGFGWAAGLPAEEVPRTLDAWCACVRDGSEWTWEFAVRGPDGLLHTILSIGRPVRDDAGRIVSWAGFHLDVSGRKEMHELRKSEELFRRTFDQSPVGTALVSLEHRLIRVNAAFAHLLGYDEAELTAMRCAAITHPDDHAAGLEFERRLMQGEIDHYLLEKRYIRKDGEVIWGTLNKRLIRDSRGQPIYFLSMVVDITARKRAEDSLFREKERAQVTLRSIGEGVITTTPSGSVEFLNPVAEAMTGWTSQQAQGRPLSEVFHIVDEETGQVVRDPVRRCLREARVVGVGRNTVLTHHDGTTFAIEGSAAPIRGCNSERLGAVLVFRDVTEPRRMARQMQHDAAHDPLTGLVNRREFERRLECAVAGAQAGDLQHAICYFDLDQFKIINDTAGHVAGDALLQHVQSLLAGKIRMHDTLARLGGDEFVILLENCPLTDAIRIGETIVKSFREWRFHWHGRSFRVGASVGVVAIDADTESSTHVLSAADMACYAAKERGRGRVHVYRPDAAESVQHQAQLLVASSLSEALENGRFRLCAQPIVSLNEMPGMTRRYEVLVRLLDAEGHLMPPRMFIPAAERYGLMNAVDRWVMTHAFRSYMTYCQQEASVEIAVNVSGETLSHDDFPRFVFEQLSVTGIPPARICFEVTETAAVRNLDQAVEFFAALRRHGSKIALDDFGSGLSSFRYLRALAADYLKIDGSFVRRIAEDPHDAAMVAAITQMSQTLGMRTIAEYAHSPQVVERLRGLGVDYAQGHAIGPTVPLDDALG